MCEGNCKAEMEKKLDDLEGLIRYIMKIEKNSEYREGVKNGLLIALAYMSSEGLSFEEFVDKIAAYVDDESDDDDNEGDEK